MEKTPVNTPTNTAQPPSIFAKWINFRMTLFPGYLIRQSGKKVFKPLFPSGFPGVTRAEGLKEYPKATCWLAKSDYWIIVDDDTGRNVLEKIEGKLPKPRFVVATGTPGRLHRYYQKGKTLQDVGKFDLQLKKGNIDFQTGLKGTQCGWFLPGSFNPTHNMYYQTIEDNPDHEPLERQHIEVIREHLKDEIVSKQEKYTFGPGKNSKAVISNSAKAGLSNNLNKATQDIIQMFEANKSRQWDKQKYVKDYLVNFTTRYKSDKKSICTQAQQKLFEEINSYQEGSKEFFDTSCSIPKAVKGVIGRSGSHKTSYLLGEASLTPHLQSVYWSDENDKGTTLIPFHNALEKYIEKLNSRLEPSKIIKVKDLNKVNWGDQFDRFNIPGAKPSFYEILEVMYNYREEGYNHFIFDPPDLFIENPNDSKSVRPTLALWNKFCFYTGGSVCFGQNLNKNESNKMLENRGAGSFGYSTVSKVYQWVQKCDEGSKYKKEEDMPPRFMVIQLLNKWNRFRNHVVYQRETSEDNKMEFCLLPAHFVKDRQPIWLKTLHIPPQQAIELCKNKELAKRSTKEEVLEWLSTQGDQKAFTRDIKKAISKMFKCSEKYVGKILAELKNEKKLKIDGSRKEGNTTYQLVDQD